MAHRSFALVLLVAPALAFACGGKTSGSVDGGPGSSSSSGGVTGSSSGSGSGSASGSSSGGEPVDAAPTIDSPAPIVCTSNGMGGSSGGETDGGPPPCGASASETCSDGNTYHVDCQCPQASCICYVTSSSGGSGGDGVTYPGCPTCTQLSGLYSLCGFPQ